MTIDNKNRSNAADQYMKAKADTAMLEDETVQTRTALWLLRAAFVDGARWAEWKIKCEENLKYKIRSASKSWKGVDVDDFMNQLRGDYDDD